MDIANLVLKVDSTDIDEAERELKKLAKTGGSTEKATDLLTGSSKKLGTQVKNTTGSVRLMKGGVQQLGYQIQDVAVQAQMGTNAMVILGQQGPQILSVFGPGGAIAGAAIAIGAAVGGTLVSSLLESKSATDQLEESLGYLDNTARLTKDGVFELADELDRLAKTNALAAELEARAGIVGALDTIAASATLAKEKLGDMFSKGFLQDGDLLAGAFSTLEDGQRNASEVVDAFHGDMSRFNAIVIEDARNTSSSIDSVRTGYVNLGAAIHKLEGTYGATRTQAVALAGAFSQIGDASDLNDVKTLQKSLDNIAKNKGASDELVKLASDVRRFTLEAERAGVKAEGLSEFISNIGKDSEIDIVVEDVKKTVNQFYRLEDRLKEQVALYGVVSVESQLRYRIESGQIKGLEKGQDRILLGYAKELDAKRKLTAQEKIRAAESAKQEKLAEKVQREAESEAAKKEASFKRFEDSLRTEEEAIQSSYNRRLDIILKNTKEGSAKQADLKARLSEQFDQSISGEFSQPDTIDEEIARLEESFAAKRDVIRDQYGQQSELEVELTKQKNERIEALEAQKTQAMISNAQDMFDGMAGMAKVFGGEQSKSYKALFAVSQAFSLASTAMSMHTGIGKAVELGWPAMIPGIAAATSQGMAAISGVQSQSFSGAYDKGGIIPSGSVGLVGEIGPELVQGPATVTSRKETADLLNKKEAPAAPAAAPNVVVVFDMNEAMSALESDEASPLFINQIGRNSAAIKQKLGIR